MLTNEENMSSAFDKSASYNPSSEDEEVESFEGTIKMVWAKSPWRKPSRIPSITLL